MGIFVSLFLRLCISVFVDYVRSLCLRFFVKMDFELLGFFVYFVYCYLLVEVLCREEGVIVWLCGVWILLERVLSVLSFFL